MQRTKGVQNIWQIRTFLHEEFSATLLDLAVNKACVYQHICTGIQGSIDGSDNQHTKHCLYNSDQHVCTGENNCVYSSDHGKLDNVNIIKYSKELLLTMKQRHSKTLSNELVCKIKELGVKRKFRGKRGRQKIIQRGWDTNSGVHRNFLRPIPRSSYMKTVKSTKRGKRAGRRKQRPIPVILSEKHESVKNYKGQVDHENLIHIKTEPKLTSHHDNLHRLPKLFLTNCRSFNQKKQDDLSCLLRSERPGIVLLTETWLTSEKETTINLCDYNFYTCNRKNRVGGGVAILYHQDLAVTKLVEYNSNTMSALWTLLKQPGQNPLVYACVYHPPSLCSDEITLDHIITTVTKINKKHKQVKFVIGGDFNKLPLLQLETLFNMHNIVNFPTRDLSYLDKIFTDIKEYTTDHCEKMAPLDQSDHCGIIVHGCTPNTSEYRSITKRMVTPAARVQIQIDLASQSWESVYEEKDIDLKVEIFHDTVEKVYNKHCPAKSMRIRENQPCWNTPLIMKIRRAKNRAYKKGNKAWKYLANLLRTVIRKRKRTFTNTEVNTALSNSKLWWQNIRKLEGKQKAKCAVYNIDGQWLSPEEFVNAQNQYFVSIGGSKIPVVKEMEEHRNFPKRSVSIGEVKKVLQQLNTKKATNSNDYPTWITKLCADDLCLPLTDIISCMFETSRFPAKWKDAEVCPLPKVQCPTTHKDFRPISLLWHCGKVAEKFAMNIYRKEVLPHLQSNQFAYLPKLGTTDAMVQAIDDWTAQMDQEDTVCLQAVFKDFSKAFDKMQPAILIQKLQDIHVSAPVTNLALDFLTNRTQCTVDRNANKVSSKLDIQVGVPQGTISGPLFWLAFVDSLQPPNPVQTIKYADDTTCYSTIKKQDTAEIIKECGTQKISLYELNPGQVAVDYSVKWSQDNSMLLNETKTKVMYLSPQNSVQLSQNIVVRDTPLEVVDSIKFLGIIVDKNLTFKEHVEKLVSRANSRIYGLTVFKRAGLNQAGLLKLYLSNIRSCVSYGTPAWFPLILKQTKDKLEQIQKMALKAIYPECDSYEDRLAKSELLTLVEYCENLCSAYFTKVESDKNHRLHHRIPPKQSEIRRHSSRLKDTYVKDCKSKLRRNSLFMKYAA